MMLTIDREGDLFFKTKSFRSNRPSPNSKTSETQRDALVILQADEEVPHGKVVEVLDELRASGLQKIAIGAHLTTTAMMLTAFGLPTLYFSL